MDTRRIVLFTRKDQPHSENKTLEKLAKNKAKDLYDIGIVLEVVPVVLIGEEFDYSKFYAVSILLFFYYTLIQTILCLKKNS